MVSSQMTQFDTVESQNSPLSMGLRTLGVDLGMEGFGYKGFEVRGACQPGHAAKIMGLQLNLPEKPKLRLNPGKVTT